MLLVHLLFIAGVSYLWLISASIFQTSSALPYLPYLLIAFSFPHFTATYWIWMRRVTMWKREAWALGFPLFYGGLFICTAAGAIPGLQVWHLVKASYAYLIYHFAQQLYGVTLWTFLRVETTLGAWEKRAMRIFFLAFGLHALIDMEVRGTLKVLFYHSTPLLKLPESAIMVSFILCALLSVLVLGIVLRKYFVGKEFRLLTGLLPLSLAWLWFLPPFSHELALVLPVLHALQYLPFILMKKTKTSALRVLLGAAICVFVAWFLFRYLPFRIRPWGVRTELWPVLLYTLLNNHHFIIDGRIWKLRDPENADLFSAGKVPSVSPQVS